MTVPGGHSDSKLLGESQLNLEPCLVHQEKPLMVSGITMGPIMKNTELTIECTVCFAAVDSTHLKNQSGLPRKVPSFFVTAMLPSAISVLCTAAKSFPFGIEE